MRLFIAVHFSQEVKDVLLDAIGTLKAQTRSGNFTRQENLHLTLAFIGETTNVAAVRATMDLMTAPPFSITVGGFGRFGNLYWAGIEQSTALSALAQDLQNALRSAGFPIEKRPFKPHITLARQVVPNGPLSVRIPKTPMPVTKISLMKSERVGGKLTYTELYGKTL